ncbi:MAG: hypothetical protein WCI55_08135 [Armatimonadota bacterium]
MAELPPWLNVGPQNFLSAAESGARAGQNAASMAIQQQQFAQQQAARQQELQEAQKNLLMERQASQQQHQQDFLYKMQQDNIANQYKAMTLNQAHDQSLVANAQAAQKFAFEQQKEALTNAEKEKAFTYKKEQDVLNLAHDERVFKQTESKSMFEQWKSQRDFEQKGIESEIKSQDEIAKMYLGLSSKSKDENERRIFQNKAEAALNASYQMKLRLNAILSSEPPSIGSTEKKPASAVTGSNASPAPIVNPPAAAPVPVNSPVTPPSETTQSTGDKTLVDLYKRWSTDPNLPQNKRDEYEKMANQLEGKSEQVQTIGPYKVKQMGGSPPADPAPAPASKPEGESASSDDDKSTRDLGMGELKESQAGEKYSNRKPVGMGEVRAKESEDKYSGESNQLTRFKNNLDNITKSVPPGNVAPQALEHLLAKNLAIVFDVKPKRSGVPKYYHTPSSIVQSNIKEYIKKFESLPEAQQKEIMDDVSTEFNISKEKGFDELNMMSGLTTEYDYEEPVIKYPRISNRLKNIK